MKMLPRELSPEGVKNRTLDAMSIKFSRVVIKNDTHLTSRCVPNILGVEEGHCAPSFGLDLLGDGIRKVSRVEVSLSGFVSFGGLRGKLR